ncbi:MAG: hypothetical protein AAGF45_00475 [Pseudomonadota bacterium]
MNTLAKTTDAATPVALDMVRALPRRVVGFSTIIETGLDEDTLRSSLEAMAAESAFTLENLTVEGPGPSPMSQFVRAEFALVAKRGTTGDPQIFALLRDVAAVHRWNGVDKHLAR